MQPFTTEVINIMGKKSEQLEMFSTSTEIEALGIEKQSISFGDDGATIKADIVGVITTRDLAKVTKEVWAQAIADWLIELSGDAYHAQDYINMADTKRRENKKRDVQETAH